MIVVRDIGFNILPIIRCLEDKAGIRLRLAEKILLAEVGTVEQMLSIILDSSIRVSVVRQVEQDGIIEREVSISNNDESIIIAKSIIYADTLPNAVLDDIRGRRLSIGSIINKHSLEAFRRILEIGYDPASDILYRVYEILHNGKVAMRVREDIVRRRLLN